MGLACVPTQHRHEPASSQMRKCCGREWAYPYSYRVHLGNHGKERRPLADRFWPKVDRRGPDECWPWMAGLDNGYGVIGAGGATGSPLRAHRVAYELLRGPIPAGMDLDHQCHNRDLACLGGESCLHRRCVNPAHMDPATRRENTLRSPVARPAVNARKTKCHSGHPLVGANVYRDPSGARSCVICRRASNALFRAAHPDRHHRKVVVA